MTEYFDNTLCIEAGWLTGDGAIMTKSNYDALKNRGLIKQLRIGGNGRTALIEYASIPERFKEKIIEKIGDPTQFVKYRHFRALLVPDRKAISFFSEYRLENNRILPTEKAKEYCNNAMFLNAIGEMQRNMSAKRKALGGQKTGIWQSLSNVINDLRGEYEHTLPGNPLRLKEKFRQYKDEGYDSLVHSNFGNQNSRKVNDEISKLLLSLSAMTNNPFVEHVHEMYMRFHAGDLLVVNTKTAEQYNRFDFYKDGKPIMISTATVWNVLRNPANEGLVNKSRLSASDYSMTQMPYARRSKPQYSLSKITMDDRTLPRKAADGTWVNAYYAMDVMSEVYLAYVYAFHDPDTGMIMDCFRHLYKNIDDNKLMWPAEVEVENHLMKQLKPILNNSFDIVRFCNPKNSREKRAEHLIRIKKYTDEKKHQSGIGRWYGKGAYKSNEDLQIKISKEQAVADDIESINRHNNALHPDQKRFPGQSRWQVLVNNMHPDLSRPQKFRIFKEIGFKIETSVQNKDSVRVQYEEYWIDQSILQRLKPNNYNVDAYFIPDITGQINEVFLYQEDEFLCKSDKIQRYNESLFEQTEKDKEIMLIHQKRQAKRRKQVKDGVLGKISKVEVLLNDMDRFESMVPEIVENQEKESEFEYPNHDMEWMNEEAINSL